MSLKLPETIRIGPGDWAIAVAPLPEYGLCDEAQRTIVVREGMDPLMTRITLWHEIVHAMLFSLGYSNHNERLVDGLAYQIVQVLSDNPELSGLLAEGKRAVK